jgi:hypothetical protein
MLDNTIAFNKILVSLESALKIEASGELKVDETLDAAIDRLENTYACTFDRDVFSIQDENALMADKIDLLLKNVKQSLAELSLYINLKLYHKNLGISLADVNYLGYEKLQLITNLKYLQDEDLYKQNGDDITKSLSNTLNNTPMCSIKRLFIVLLMFHRLGIAEGVSIVAQLLYLGGLVV